MYEKFWLVWGIFWSLVAAGAWFVWHQNLEREKLTLCRDHEIRKRQLESFAIYLSQDWMRLVNILEYMASSTIKVTSPEDLITWFQTPDVFKFITEPLSTLLWNNEIVLKNPATRAFVLEEFSELAQFLFIYIQMQKCNAKAKEYSDNFILACCASSFAFLGFFISSIMFHEKIKPEND